MRECDNVSRLRCGILGRERENVWMCVIGRICDWGVVWCDNMPTYSCECVARSGCTIRFRIYIYEYLWSCQCFPHVRPLYTMRIALWCLRNSVSHWIAAKNLFECRWPYWYSQAWRCERNHRALQEGCELCFCQVAFEGRVVRICDVNEQTKPSDCGWHPAVICASWCELGGADVCSCMMRWVVGVKVVSCRCEGCGHRLACQINAILRKSMINCIKNRRIYK